VGGTDDIAFKKRLKRNFDEFEKVYKILWKNGEIRQKAIDIISRVGEEKRENYKEVRENYRAAFKLLIRKYISKSRGHSQGVSKKVLKGEPINVASKKVMNISYRIKKKNGIDYFVIEGIEVCNEHLDRKNLTIGYENRLMATR